jgi:anti-anti-sigma regulatory factor
MKFAWQREIPVSRIPVSAYYPRSPVSLGWFLNALNDDQSLSAAKTMMTKKTAIKRVSIKGGMTIYHAAEIKQRLIDGLRGNAVLEVDLSDVDEIDTAGVQLLALVKLESSRLKHELHIVRHSPTVREAIELLNLVALFGDPLVIPANTSP